MDNNIDNLKPEVVAYIEECLSLYRQLSSTNSEYNKPIYQRAGEIARIVNEEYNISEDELLDLVDEYVEINGTTK